MIDQELADRTQGCSWQLTQVMPTTYDEDGYTDDLGWYVFTSSRAPDERRYCVVMPRVRFWFGAGGPYAYRPADDKQERMLARLRLWHDTAEAWGHNPRPAPVKEDVADDDCCPYCGHDLACGEHL